MTKTCSTVDPFLCAIMHLFLMMEYYIISILQYNKLRGLASMCDDPYVSYYKNELQTFISVLLDRQMNFCFKLWNVNNFFVSSMILSSVFHEVAKIKPLETSELL